MFFFGSVRATTIERNGDFVLCDIFDILYVLLKFIKNNHKRNNKICR